MFRGFAVILIVWFGVKARLGSAGGGTGPLFHFDNFADLLMTIAFGYAMITFYSTPIPGFGVSFYHLIIDQGQNLANQLNNSIVQEVWDRLTGLYWGMETPGLSLAFNIMEIIRYGRDLLCIIVAQAAVFTVIAFGVHRRRDRGAPGSDFHSLFHRAPHGMAFLGLARSLIQYAFYPVVANAYMYVFGNLLIHFVDSHPPPYDRDASGALLPAGAALDRLYLRRRSRFRRWSIRSFTGRSGESALPH